MLTPDQVDAYHRDGFVVVPDFVSDGQCDRLRRRANEMVDAWEPGAERTYSENQIQTIRIN